MLFPETEWIFFDCFNTLIDDFDEAGEEGNLHDIPRLAVEAELFPSTADFLAAYHVLATHSKKLEREIPLVDRLRQLLDSVTPRLPPETISAVVPRLMEAWERDFARALRPTPGVYEMLEYWALRRPLAVVTNSLAPGLATRYLNQFNLGRYFRFVLDSASFGFKKPSPLLEMEALSQAGLGPGDAERVLCVGDRHEIDIKSALALGMHVVHFNRSRTRPGTPPTPAELPAIYDWSEFR